MPGRQEWIEDVAGAILDGASIDWASAESHAEAAEQSLLDMLRVLATVADIHRQTGPRTRPCRETPSDDPLAVENGAAIVDGKYRLERCLGRGGMGVVYHARHLELGKTFALKLVRPRTSHSAEHLARFRVEAQSLGRLNHPNIVQVTDFGVDPRVGQYLVMEYIDGIPLSEYIGRTGPLTVDEALPILGSISLALDYAHDCGILHRDLKPANVLLPTCDGTHRGAKIVDFGIASFLEPSNSLESKPGSTIGSRVEPPQSGGPGDPTPRNQREAAPAPGGLTAPGTVVGTLEYIAPEVLEGGNASPAGDIYAFGILVYEVLVGRRPFAASPLGQVDSHVRPDPPLPSEVSSSVPNELDQAILKPLHKDPGFRPLRACDVVAQLHQAQHQYLVRQWRQQQLPRRALLSAAIAGLVLLLHPLLQALPPVQALENTLLDARMRLEPLRAPDSRIVLLAIDEATLAADAAPLAEKADEVGSVLGSVFDAGAKVVAVDLLLPEQWSRSESFAKLILDHSPNLVLASYSKADGGVTGPESVQGLVTVALGRDKIEDLFGFVNLAADPDGVVRTMRSTYRDERGRSVPSLPARTAGIIMTGQLNGGADTRFFIDYAVDWTKFQRVSWKDAPSVLMTTPEVFRDRIVLVGGEFAGSGDIHPVVRHRALPSEASGLVLQALSLNTLLDGRRFTPSHGALVAASLCLVSGIAIFALLYLPRSGWTMATVGAGGVLYVALSFALFRWNRQLWPIVAPVLAFSFAIAGAAILRHRLPAFPETATEKAT